MKDDGSGPRAISIFPSICRISLLSVGISMWTRFHMAFLFPKSTQISKSVTSLILPTITGGCSCHFHQGRHWVEDPLIRPCYMPS